MKLGFHVSIAGSLDYSVDRAKELGCTTFQMFTRNPRTWKVKPISPREVEAFRKKLDVSKIRPVYSHMPYLPNLSSSDEEIYRRSVESLLFEVERCHLLGIPYVVTHMGSHKGAGRIIGEKRLTDALGLAVDIDGPTILLENDSGSGAHIGSKLTDINRIIRDVGGTRLGLCFDTCHAYAAGYDVSTPKGLKETEREINKSVGFSRLKLVHLNDSVGQLGSRVDRHEHIGLGRIGEYGFKLMLASRLAKRPLIMETPIDARRSDKENMAKIMELAGLKR
jgi:deoxyribonuclease-4